MPSFSSTLRLILAASWLSLPVRALAADPPAPAGPPASTETSSAAEAEPPPFSFVSSARRMSAADLAKKREGFFVTALPFFSSDPLNGVGGGATGYLHFNGARSDKLFAYTPYKARLGVTGQYTTGDAATLALKLDLPFVADTGWRVKVDGKYESPPNNLYFGLTERTLDGLSREKYASHTKALARTRPGGPGEAPWVADSLRHRFREKEWMFNPKLERTFGNLRVLAGYEIQHLAYQTYENTTIDAVDSATGTAVRVPNGRSALREDADAGRAFGIDGGRVSLVQLSLMYDTRDYEPDPSRGVFFEWATEHSSKLVGSQFSFTKMLLQARHYLRIAPRHLQRTVLATRIGYGTILGREAPFFEYQDQWSAEGSIRALGGSQTLRGYKANRFLGRTVGFVNMELRHRVAEVDWLRQNISFTVAPFMDLGSVGDEVFVVAPVLRGSGGASLRVGWNRSTVVTFDAAFSHEDRQFFLSFNNSY